MSDTAPKERPDAAHPEAVGEQARLHHAWLLGMQLTVSMECGGDVMEEWMFRLFRRQHLENFLSSFAKLGLTGLPDAVACARYHVLSNGIGGVPVEYMEESDTKAWVRFRYPRWMYDGPTICGVPVGVSRGFLRGWYAHNGVSLGNARLGFVCVSEDMTGEFGMCGYFLEHDRDLADDERLRFARDERPPPFDPDAQPIPPPGEWTPLRLARANRNYALAYIRNGLVELASVIGVDRARELGGRAARLIGLQYFASTATALGESDGDAVGAARYLAHMFAGMGDRATVTDDGSAARAVVEVQGRRITRGLAAEEASLVFHCWTELWRGTVRSHRRLMDLEVTELDGDLTRWRVSDPG